MQLDGPDFWGNKAREIRVLLYQRWKECRRLSVEGIPAWPEIAAQPDLAMLRDLERRLETSGARKTKTRKK